MKRDYDLLLKEGRKAQIEKLKKNDHKCGFDTEPVELLFIKLLTEVEELRFEINAIKQDWNKIRHEAADVANYAFMIILKCVQMLYREKK